MTDESSSSSSSKVVVSTFGGDYTFKATKDRFIKASVNSRTRHLVIEEVVIQDLTKTKTLSVFREWRSWCIDPGALLTYTVNKPNKINKEEVSHLTEDELRHWMNTYHDNWTRCHNKLLEIAKMTDINEVYERDKPKLCKICNRHVALKGQLHCSTCLGLSEP